jgi:protein-S-isoprenylcysteine O-methyltransferase Ste14
VIERPATAPAIRGRLAGVLAYALLFAVALPVGLAAWMRGLDAVVSLPDPAWPAAGVVLVVAGLAMMAAATLSLWTSGGGLPMSPYPPIRSVSVGLYWLVADPIYMGAVVTCAGSALAWPSPAGVWIVTPVLALSAVAFVLGYERDATRARFGDMLRPVLSLPPATDETPDLGDRAAIYVLVFLPWAVAFRALNVLGAQAGAHAVVMEWERSLPVVPWTEWVGVLAYPCVLLAPLAARRRRDLRRFGRLGLVATATLALWSLLVPAAAFPAPRLVWTCIASGLYAATWPRARWAAWTIAAAVAVGSVTAGLHTTAEVVFGLAACLLVSRSEAVWAGMCRLAERVANSWREWRLGPARFMSHGIYAGLGGAVGAAVAIWAAGPAQLWWIVGFTLGAQLGAGLWAQLVEGSSQLLRPYGYFGSVAAVTVLAIAAGLAGYDGWLLLAAMAVGGCFAQAIGRLRCLVQGCCHGRPVDAGWGVRFTHPRSRVVRLSGLSGAPLHPTQLYSSLWTLAVGFALVRLWLLAVPLTFVVGSYLVLIGLGRFVEEHFRGEPQTACVAGLRLYQWFAIGFVISGAALTTLGGPPSPHPSAPGLEAVAPLALVALVSSAAYGLDVPGSNRRFSRLT